jgi:thiosulfate/3-mercaptopyruvate sulfurtransferase
MRDKFVEKELFLQSADKLAARFGALGIGNDTPVVLYAEDKMQDATQVALAFLRAGHRRLAILEGGLLRWAADQLPMDNAVVAVTPAQYVPIADADDFTITVDQLAQRVQAKDVEILDVRPTDFFVGDKSTEARPGHIPGARNRLFSKDLVRTESGHWWLADDELRKKYEALGFAPDDSIVVHCRTGHTASTTYFVLRHMLGYKDVKWFNGSWTEWAERKDLPAETGPGANQ